MAHSFSTEGVAVGSAPSQPTVGLRQVRAAISWLERQALFVAGLAVVAAVILGKAPAHLNQDGWLALVDGRYVAQHGIPQHDTLAVLTRGTHWIDQQWLAQLTIYGLDRVGGLALYSIVYVGLTVGSFALAIAASRRLGGSERHVVWVLPLAAFLYFADSFQIRTQGFAYPLFVGTLWLLAADLRAPSRRVYLVFPVLVLWGNLHGSASLGAGLLVLYGVSLLAEGFRRRRPWRTQLKGVAFLLAAPLCLLVTPYGISGFSYYQDTLLNPAFKALLVEWQPVTSTPILAVPFFVAALATVWVLGFSRGRARLFDALTLLVLIAGAISAVRNVTWFALAAAVLIPSTLSATLPPLPSPPRRRQMNLALVSLTLAVLALSAAAVASKPSSWFEGGYDARALEKVLSSANHNRGLRIFADGRYADWLLWREPLLAGRVAYDSRLELLSAGQLHDLAAIAEVRAPGARTVLAGYRLLVLDTTSKASSLLLEQPAIHVILRGRDVAVATRSGR
jgi:hypothetical protein